MEVHCLDAHSALCHHECRNRAVYAAAHQDHSLSVSAERKASETADLVPEYVCALASYINGQHAVRIMNVHAEHLACLEYHSPYLTGYLRRLNSEGFVGPLALYLEGPDVFSLYHLLHVFGSKSAYLIDILRRFNSRADRRDSEHPYALCDDFIFR